jgi:hypothetical protein
MYYSSVAITVRPFTFQIIQPVKVHLTKSHYFPKVLTPVEPHGIDAAVDPYLRDLCGTLNPYLQFRAEPPPRLFAGSVIVEPHYFPSTPSTLAVLALHEVDRVLFLYDVISLPPVFDHDMGDDEFLVGVVVFLVGGEETSSAFDPGNDRSVAVQILRRLQARDADDGHPPTAFDREHIIVLARIAVYRLERPERQLIREKIDAGAESETMVDARGSPAYIPVHVTSLSRSVGCIFPLKLT